MLGRIIVVTILALAVLGGALLYYMQVYAFYEELTPEQAGPIALSLADGSGSEPLRVSDLRAIDAGSSPIRFRACFTQGEPFDSLAARAQPYEDPRPLNAPGWFDCFDAPAIGAALESGQARAFLSAKDIRYGIDRVVALFPDGRGYAWHQINACGEVVFDGEPPPEGCPPVPESE
ncbi:DUF6446 family protein [Rubellimicrobium roseum]|uniref:Histidine kinase n=1 Tax=Rubellimicrobium roseum TaxID=687525 RepID=A0A5C4NIE7_9RHOB|nr:DUF6446 family protein [Rubellimicrobium roseum]TNC74604.1 histidine kinase [Rubellimicrobium roseum]